MDKATSVISMYIYNVVEEKIVICSLATYN